MAAMDAWVIPACQGELWSWMTSQHDLRLGHILPTPCGLGIRRGLPLQEESGALGKAVCFSQENSPSPSPNPKKGLTAEGCLPAVLPADGELSPLFLRGFWAAHQNVFLLSSIPLMNIPNIFLPSPVDEHLIPFLAIVNKASMNILKQFF